MFGWLKKLSTSTEESERAKVLYGAVRDAIGDDDDVQVRIVGSVAALLLCVAYADSDYDAKEEAVVKAQLSRVQGLSSQGVDAIATVLRDNTALIIANEGTSYARELQDLTEKDFRLEVIDLLVDLAAADDEISVRETNMMRTITRALGFSQEVYLAAQSRHRDKLAVLK